MLLSLHKIKAIVLCCSCKDAQEKRVIYEKIGILKERDPKTDKAVSCSEIEILDICSNSFTFNSLMIHFN